MGLDEGHNVAVVFGGVGVAGAKTVSPAVGSHPNWCAWTVPAARSRLSRALLNAWPARSPLDWTRARRPSPMTAL